MYDGRASRFILSSGHTAVRVLSAPTQVRATMKGWKTMAGQTADNVSTVKEQISHVAEQHRMPSLATQRLTVG